MSTLEKFNLSGKTCVITGGAGFLGIRHAEAVLDGGANISLLDMSGDRLKAACIHLEESFSKERIHSVKCDITDGLSVENAAQDVIKRFGSSDILINNAADNPKVEGNGLKFQRFEDFGLKEWNSSINVGLTGAFLCSQAFGVQMCRQKKGVIINISSDLGVIAPDQRIYRKDGLPEGEQGVKPVTYSVIKHGIIGLTKYLATYWADYGIRVNSISPGGVYNGQDTEFLDKLTNLIPMKRMANIEEYKGTILFLASDASSYMTGANVIVDGGRTCW